MDNVLGVNEWRVPGVRIRSNRVQESVPDGAPSWWKGDQEASDSFLREMGVNL